jgi:hypothetical protein
MKKVISSQHGQGEKSKEKLKTWTLFFLILYTFLPDD